jgi:hypothetical protein
LAPTADAEDGRPETATAPAKHPLGR